MNWPPKRVYKHQIKAQKLDQLIGPQIADDSSPESLKTIFNPLENFPLSDSENQFSIRAWILFPFPKRPLNFQLSKTLKNFFDAFNWKPSFMTKRMILTPQTKILSKHFKILKSRWTPVEGPFASLVFSSKNVAILTNWNSIVTPNS